MKSISAGFLLLLYCLYACNNSDSGTSMQISAGAATEVKAIFVNGDSVHFVDVGKGDPVIFLHGALADYRVWGAQIDTFSKSHRAIAYSSRFAYPNKPVANNFISQIFVPVTEAFKNSENEKAVRILANGVMGDTLFYLQIPQSGRDMMMDNMPAFRGSVLSNTSFPPVSCEDLGKLKLPVLLLKGERTLLFFSAIIGEPDRCLTNRETITIPNSSHGLEMDNPAEFNRVVLGFIDKH